MLPGMDQNLETHESMIRIREDLISSPPLELRRQLTTNPNIPSARQITAVPHSLQSPHDRTTGNHCILPTNNEYYICIFVLKKYLSYSLKYINITFQILRK